MSGRRNGCQGKIRHKSQAGAIKAMRAMHNLQLNTYKCKLCGCWHVGNSSKPWKVQARIDQILNQEKRKLEEKVQCPKNTPPKA